MKVGIGQDSHKFDFANKEKKLILGGIVFEGYAPLFANSDGDVVLHALTNAISGITCKNILGKTADGMCKSGITNSEYYVLEALQYLNIEIEHVSIAIECKIPKISPKIDEMRENISRILKIDKGSIGMTATSGEGLTEFGKGNGINVFCIITTK